MHFIIYVLLFLYLELNEQVNKKATYSFSETFVIKIRLLQIEKNTILT